MNKLLLYLPKKQILSYLNKNFEKLTEIDFFNIVSRKIKIPKEYYQRNQTLASHPTVLKYILENDLDALFQFNNEAFTEENLHILANLDFSFTKEEIASKTVILNNEKICEKLIEKNQSVIALFTEEQLTPNIIKILEQKKYLVSKEDLKKFPILSESKILMINAFMNDVNMLVELSPTFITDDIIISAFHREFLATKEDLEQNPYLCNFIEIMKPAIENNPELIRYITSSCNISPNLIKEALQKYKITKEDLEQNPYLRSNTTIMESVINENEKLIVYTSSNCYLSSECILKALQKYKITKEDLIKHKELRENITIMCHTPELEL